MRTSASNVDRPRHKAAPTACRHRQRHRTLCLATTDHALAPRHQKCKRPPSNCKQDVHHSPTLMPGTPITTIQTGADGGERIGDDGATRIRGWRVRYQGQIGLTEAGMQQFLLPIRTFRFGSKAWIGPPHRARSVLPSYGHANDRLDGRRQQPAHSGSCGSGLP